jgi:hypothetical protein
MRMAKVEFRGAGEEAQPTEGGMISGAVEMCIEVLRGTARRFEERIGRVA